MEGGVKRADRGRSCRIDRIGIPLSSNLSVPATFSRQFSAAPARQDYNFSSRPRYHRKEHPLLPLERPRAVSANSTHSPRPRKAKKATSENHCHVRSSPVLALADPKTAELALETGTIVTSVVDCPRTGHLRLSGEDARRQDAEDEGEQPLGQRARAIGEHECCCCWLLLSYAARSQTK